MFGLSAAGWRRAALRRLLLLDKPVSKRSEEELLAEARENFRWNFTVNFLDGAFFWFGLSFISNATILPLFVSKLSPSPLLIGLVAVLGQASWFLPQLFVAGPTERLARKKPVVVNLGWFTERLPLWFLPVAALAALYSPTLALVIFFLAYAAHGIGAGVIGPAWTDLIARCFPVEHRGRFFGITSFVGTGLGALGAIFSGRLLEAHPFPYNFALVFLIAAVAVAISWIFIAMTREPVTEPPEAARLRTIPARRKIMSITRGDHNFRRYLIARVVSSLGAMAIGFVTVAAIQRWQVSDSMVGYFTASFLVGQTLGNLAAGFVADRLGHKVALETGIGGLLAAFLLAWLAPLAVLYYPVFLLMGAATGITIVSGILIALEFSLPEHRPTYVGIANTTMGLGNAVAPLLGGLLATVAGYNALFVVSALFGAVAWLMMRFWVQEPRGQTEYFDVATGMVQPPVTNQVAP